jgi:CIC family chloride channel protein
MDHPDPYVPSQPFAWFPEFLEIVRRRSRSQVRLLASAILVGIVAGWGAIVFAVACQAVVRVSLDAVAGYRPHGPRYEARVSWIPESSEDRGPDRPWLLLVTPAVGGLISGWLVFRFAPEAEGHGTDSVIAAYHYKQGEMRSRVPLVKLLASAITLGTGGSGGREGPIAQIGAGFGSLLGRLLKLRPDECRILLAAGMGAGIAAIFRAPLAGALFAAEVLYRSPEFEPEVILPAGLASVVAYSTFGLYFEWNPLFAVPADQPFNDVRQLLPYSMLALAMPLLAMLYTRTFYWFTNLFQKLPLPRMLKPAVGAGLSGGIGVGLYFLFGRNPHVLSVLSFGYGVLQDGMSKPAELTALVLLAVALGKILTTSLTIGSGGSGGVFGPSMVIGGCGAGALGVVLHRFLDPVWPGVAPSQVSFMIVGMAGFFAAAAKTPFSTLVIVCELTGNYHLIVPALWVCTISFLLSDEQSLYQSQVPGRAYSPAHQGAFLRAVLTGYTVGQVLTGAGKVSPLKPDDPIDAVIERFDAAGTSVLPVVDGDNKLLGVVHLNELFWTSTRREDLPWVLAVDLMRGNVKPLTPELTLEEAVELFAENDLPELPVVRAGHDRTLLGTVRRTDIAKEYLRRVHAPRAGV